MKKNKQRWDLDVSAVLVTYNPNLDELLATVQAVSDQVSDIFIIDNASINYSADWLKAEGTEFAANVHLHPLPINLGIGAAHNIGIKLAQNIGSKFVLLLDQDSQVAHNMLQRLIESYDSLSAQGIEVAALGPRYRDPENDTLSNFVRVGFFSFSRINPNITSKIVEADFLVSSGSLLPLSSIKKVGFMDEGLFIDHVDTDWCFRAKHIGLGIFGVTDALMIHTLGDRRRQFWFFRKRTVHFHQPFRYYYIFRNSVLLYKRPYMPLRWKLADVARNFKVMVFFGCFGSHRIENVRMMIFGLIDGMKNVSGKMESS